MRERLDGRGRAPALARNDLVGVAGVDVLDDARHVGLEGLARHVGLEHRLLARTVPLDLRQRAGEPGADGADRLHRAGVRRVDVGVVEIGVGEDRDRVAQMVEGHDHVAEHQRHVRQPDHVGIRLRQALDGPHAVEAEEAHSAARERRQAGDLRLPHGRDRVMRERVRVSPVLQAPAQHLLRAPADERPATDLLALLGGLEQERRAVAAQLQERRHRRLAVLDEAVRDRDQVVVAGQAARLLERRRDLDVLSDGGQGAPPPRPRG